MYQISIHSLETIGPYRLPSSMYMQLKKFMSSVKCKIVKVDEPKFQGRHLEILSYDEYFGTFFQ